MSWTHITAKTPENVAFLGTWCAAVTGWWVVKCGEKENAAHGLQGRVNRVLFVWWLLDETCTAGTSSNGSGARVEFVVRAEGPH